MTLLHTLLTAIALLQPVTGKADARPVGPEQSVNAWAGSIDTSCCAIRRRTDMPTPSRLFFESLDETALDEEDTDEIKISSVISQAVFGENSFLTALLHPSAPQRLHAHSPATQSILRC
jgi:hypothetical protein